MKKQSLLFAIATLAAITFSCRYDRDSDDRYFDSQDLSGVSRLKINGVINLLITQGDDESLTVEGSPDLADRLTIEQKGDLLELKLEEFSGSFFQKNELRVQLTVSNLEELVFEGVGNIKTTGPLEVEALRIRGKGVGNIELEVAAENLEAELNLMGNMSLKGQANWVRLINEGVGNIDAARLVAQKMELKSSGIGHVSVHCEDELSIDVSGIGAVEYSGNPTVIKEKVDGIGKVTRK